MVTALSPRARVRAWTREQIKDESQSEFEIPALVEAAMNWMADQPELWREFVRPGVYEEVRCVVGAGRGSDFAVLGDAMVTPEALNKRANALQSKWARWLEHAGSRHVRLRDMTRTDLLAAAVEREKRAATEQKIARLLRALAERLTGDQRVGDVCSPSEIAALDIIVDEQEVAA